MNDFGVPIFANFWAAPKREARVARERGGDFFFKDVGWFLLVICVAHNNQLKVFSIATEKGTCYFLFSISTSNKTLLRKSRFISSSMLYASAACFIVFLSHPLPQTLRSWFSTQHAEFSQLEWTGPTDFATSNLSKAMVWLNRMDIK